MWGRAENIQFQNFFRSLSIKHREAKSSFKEDLLFIAKWRWRMLCFLSTTGLTTSRDSIGSAYRSILLDSTFIRHRCDFYGKKLLICLPIVEMYLWTGDT